MWPKNLEGKKSISHFFNFELNVIYAIIMIVLKKFLTKPIDLRQKNFLFQKIKIIQNIFSVSAQNYIVRLREYL